MRPDRTTKTYNLNFFDKSIEGFANMDHELVQLAQNINWEAIEKSLEGHYCNYGRKAIATRLLVGLQCCVGYRDYRMKQYALGG